MEPDRFGYLTRPLDIRFNCGEITTLPGFENQFARFEGGGLREEKFYYPCRNWEEHGLYPLFRLPSSHQLSVDFSGSRDDLRSGVAGLIMYLVGYLDGLWLQFGDWWVDRPVPGRSTHGVFVHPRVVADFVSRSVDLWRQWSFASQRQAIHMLYMDARAPSYFR